MHIYMYIYTNQQELDVFAVHLRLACPLPIGWLMKIEGFERLPL